MERFQGITKPPKRESQTARKSQENHPWSGHFLQFQIPHHAENTRDDNRFDVLNSGLIPMPVSTPSDSGVGSGWRIIVAQRSTI
jgi:hypothetical protein